MKRIFFNINLFNFIKIIQKIVSKIKLLINLIYCKLLLLISKASVFFEYIVN